METASLMILPSPIGLIPAARAWARTDPPRASSAPALRQAAKELGGAEQARRPGQTIGTRFTDFQVIPTGSWGDPEIRFKYDGEPAFAMVTQAAWEDYFRIPGGRHFSSNDARLVCQANLEGLAKIIAKRMTAGEYQTMNRVGTIFPLVVLDERDLRQAEPGLNMELLHRARAPR